MYLEITVERIASEFMKQVWAFGVLEQRGTLCLVLESWSLQERASKRHKWKQSDNSYSRLSHRNSLDESEVELPEDVAQEAQAQLVSRIKVGKWRADFGEMK